MNATAREISKIMSKPTCSVEEMAMALQLSRNSAYKAVRSGEVRSIRIGKRVLVPTAAIRQLLEGETGHAA